MPRKPRTPPAAIHIESGEDLRVWCEYHGWTIRSLAAALRVSRASVERWRADNPPPPFHICIALEGLLALREAGIEVGG